MESDLVVVKSVFRNITGRQIKRTEVRRGLDGTLNKICFTIYLVQYSERMTFVSTEGCGEPYFKFKGNSNVPNEEE